MSSTVITMITASRMSALSSDWRSSSLVGVSVDLPWNGVYGLELGYILNFGSELFKQFMPFQCFRYGLKRMARLNVSDIKHKTYGKWGKCLAIMPVQCF
jgi:hypothetical protein